MLCSVYVTQRDTPDCYPRGQEAVTLESRMENELII